MPGMSKIHGVKIIHHKLSRFFAQIPYNFCSARDKDLLSSSVQARKHLLLSLNPDILSLALPFEILFRLPRF